MQRWLQTILLSTLLLIIPFSILMAGSDHVPDQLLIQVQPDVGFHTTTLSSQSLQNLIDNFSAVTLTPKRKLSPRWNIWQFSFDAQAITAKNLLLMVKDHPSVQVAQLNHYVSERQTFPNDPYFGQEWGLHNTGSGSGVEDADIDAPEAAHEKRPI